MAWRSSGSLARSLLSNARRAPSRRSVPSSLPRGGIRPTQATIPAEIAPSRRFFSSAILRNSAALGCTQSLLPLHSVVAAARMTSHVAVEARACCELSQGT